MTDADIRIVVPRGEAMCILADGTVFTVAVDGGAPTLVWRDDEHIEHRLVRLGMCSSNFRGFVVYGEFAR